MPRALPRPNGFTRPWSNEQVGLISAEALVTILFYRGVYLDSDKLRVEEVSEPSLQQQQQQ